MGCCLKRFQLFLILITGNHAFSFVHSHTPNPPFSLYFHTGSTPLHAGEIISSSLVYGSDRVRACPAYALAWEGRKVRSSKTPPRV